MVTSARAGRLLGRQRELAVLERLLDGARDGHGAVLVVHGDPGVGKTAAARAGSGGRRGLSCHPNRGGRGRGGARLRVAGAAVRADPRARRGSPRPAARGARCRLRPQRRPTPEPVPRRTCGSEPRSPTQRSSSRSSAWSTTRSGSTGPRPAHSRSSLGASSRSGSCSHSRRATREAGSRSFPQLRVEPLGRRDARTLLESVLAARLDEPVLERIVAETGGNPLAILELPRGLTPAQLAGGFGLPAALPLSTGIEQSFRRRLARLPPDARRLLLLAAAEPLGDPALLWRSARADRDPRDGRRHGRVGRLVDPRRRGDVPASARPVGRLRLGGAGRATRGPPCAGGRNRSGARPGSPRLAPGAGGVGARRGGGRRARALRRTGAGARWTRGCRGLPRARRGADSGAGASRTAPARRRRAPSGMQATWRQRSGLLAGVEPEALDELGQARADLLRAQIALEQQRGGDAGRLFLDAASRLEPLDPKLARETYLEALGGAMANDVEVAGGALGGRGGRPGGATRPGAATDGRRGARCVRDPPARRIRCGRADARAGTRAPARDGRRRRGRQPVALARPAGGTATSLRSRPGTTRRSMSSRPARWKPLATRARSCTCSSRSASWRGATCSPASWRPPDWCSTRPR